jgi:hypothetical protein
LHQQQRLASDPLTPVFATAAQENQQMPESDHCIKMILVGVNHA